MVQRRVHPSLSSAITMLLLWKASFKVPVAKLTLPWMVGLFKRCVRACKSPATMGMWWFMLVTTCTPTTPVLSPFQIRFLLEIPSVFLVIALVWVMPGVIPRKPGSVNSSVQLVGYWGRGHGSSCGGNHEECERSGHGWFRYLDPSWEVETFMLPYCVSYSNPYNVEFEHDNWLVVDSSSVANEDISIDAYPPLEYTEAEARAARTEPILSMDNCDTKPTSGDVIDLCRHSWWGPGQPWGAKPPVEREVVSTPLFIGVGSLQRGLDRHQQQNCRVLFHVEVTLKNHPPQIKQV